MKRILMLGISLLSLRAMAVDTSGCSPMPQSTQTVSTAKSATLSVTAVKPTSSSCWNTNLSAVQVRYSWFQSSADASGIQAQTWIQVNGRAATEPASVSCQPNSSLTYGQGPSNNSYVCTSEAQFQVGGGDSWTVEVAPVVNGAWDTAGYGVNYHFQF